MIDTHGLPMKFEFCWRDSSGRDHYYEVDFENRCHGNPCMTALSSGDKSWHNDADTYVDAFRRGVWVMIRNLEEPRMSVPVEDLL